MNYSLNPSIIMKISEGKMVMTSLDIQENKIFGFEGEVVEILSFLDKHKYLPEDPSLMNLPLTIEIPDYEAFLSFCVENEIIFSPTA